MSWFRRNLPWVLLTLTVGLTLMTLGFVAVSGLALFAGLLGGASLGAFLADAAVVALVGTVLIAADVSLALVLVVTVLRRLAFPTSQRVASRFRRLESLFPPLAAIGFSKPFQPSVEERTRTLKRRYVEGELSEVEFERRMDALLVEVESGPEAVATDLRVDEIGRDSHGRQAGRRRETDPDWRRETERDRQPMRRGSE